MQVNVTKIVLYVLLTLAAVYCSRQFVARYSLLMSTEVDSGAYAIEGNGRPTLPVVVSPETNVVEGNPGGNEGEYPVESVESGSGGSSTGANTAVASNLVSTPSAADPDPMASVPLTKGGFDRGQAPDTSGIGLYAVAMFGVLIALGVLAAHDVSTFMAQRAHKLLHNEEGEGIVDVDYDHAEQVWADGDHLGAIRLMREYLEKNPREVHVMVRIAEIYEKDLGNFLAAALEYEEILKHKLPAERWGWSAIHLVNLYYGKLDKPAQGLALLWRIHREYGQTQAAAKARKRLAQIDPDFASEQERLEAEAIARQEDELEESETAQTPEPAWTPPAEDDASNLPKGFRPKKL